MQRCEMDFAENAEKLIEEVKKYEVLYNTGHPDYKNHRQSLTIWRNIAVHFGCSGEDLKKKWRTLRDNYRKHLRYFYISTAQDARATCKYRNWPWAKQMSFMRPYLQLAEVTIEKQEIKSEDEDPSDWPGESVTIEDPLIEVLIQDQEGYSQQYQSPEMVSRDVPEEGDRHKRRKRRREKFDSTQDSEELSQGAEADRSVLYFEERKIKEESDEVELFCLSLAKSIKRFSIRRQAVIKYKISKLLMEEDLKQQDEDIGSTSASCESTMK